MAIKLFGTQVLSMRRMTEGFLDIRQVYAESPCAVDDGVYSGGLLDSSTFFQNQHQAQQMALAQQQQQQHYQQQQYQGGGPGYQ